MSEQEILIPSTQNSSVFSKWKLELETINQGFYGYGYAPLTNFKPGLGLHGVGTATFSSAPDSFIGIIETELNWQIGYVFRVEVTTGTTKTFNGIVMDYDPITGYIYAVLNNYDDSKNGAGAQGIELYSDLPDPLDYFNVLGIEGTQQGYGFTFSDSPANEFSYIYGYNYGWGYEYSNYILADQEDSITIRARVLKDDIPQENIKVWFDGSPIFILNPIVDTTDGQGYAYTNVTINKDISINQIDGFDSYSYAHGSVRQNFRNISGSGSKTINATIYELPEFDDGNLFISSELEYKFFEEVVFNLNIGSYAFNEGEDL